MTDIHRKWKCCKIDKIYWSRVVKQLSPLPSQIANNNNNHSLRIKPAEVFSGIKAWFTVASSFAMVCRNQQCWKNSQLLHWTRTAVLH